MIVNTPYSNKTKKQPCLMEGLLVILTSGIVKLLDISPAAINSYLSN